MAQLKLNQSPYVRFGNLSCFWDHSCGTPVALAALGYLRNQVIFSVFKAVFLQDISNFLAGSRCAVAVVCMAHILPSRSNYLLVNCVASCATALLRQFWHVFCRYATCHHQTCCCDHAYDNRLHVLSIFCLLYTSPSPRD